MVECYRGPGVSVVECYRGPGGSVVECYRGPGGSVVECLARAARSRVCTSIPAVTFCAINNDKHFLFCFSLLSIEKAAALFDIFTVFKVKKNQQKINKISVSSRGDVHLTGRSTETQLRDLG